MTIAISGSVAFDTIMVFDGRFRDHILPDQVHMLNVAFLVPGMRREFGGCAANIAFNLNKLGGACTILGSIGDDGLSYRDRLREMGVGTDAMLHAAGSFSAQAFITTDMDDNQITAFHPGAMMMADQIGVPEGVTLGIVAPNAKGAMLRHAQEFAQRKIPFIFDPGQGLPMFDGEELRTLIDQASYVAVNDYEGQMLQDRTGWSPQDIASRVDALIVTRGAEGSRIYTGGEMLDIPVVKVDQAVDPTGCGDSYRAGLLYGLSQGYDWLTIGRLGSVIGAIKVQSRGGQNHQLSREIVADAFAKAYGSQPW